MQALSLYPLRSLVTVTNKVPQTSSHLHMLMSIQDHNYYIPGAKRGLFVQARIKASCIWLVVNGDWASCKIQAKVAQKSIIAQKSIKLLVMHLTSLLVYYRHLTKDTSRFNLEIVIFKNFQLFLWLPTD